MSYLLVAVPLIALMSGILVYRLNGQREIFRLDVVQFFYTFIIFPLVFIWAKSVLYSILRTELGNGLSQRALFLYDTFFSLLLMYVFAFVVIHAVTKSFSLKKWSDPKYNIFIDSEYFHVWLTHIVMFVGGQLLLTVIGLVNAFFTIPLHISRTMFYALDIAGFITGTLIFIAIIPLSDPQQKGRNFRRMMKISFGLFFIIHAFTYILGEIPFNGTHGMFWFNSFLFTALVVWSALARNAQIRKWLEKETAEFKHDNWNKRLQVFGKQST